MAVSVAVDPVLVRNVAVVIGLLAIVGYLGLRYRRWPAVLAVLLALGAFYFVQQVTFSAVVVPELRLALGDQTFERALEIQAAFEIGFAVKVVVLGVELAVEQVVTDEGPLRTMKDGLLGGLNVVVILAIIAVLAVASATSGVVLSVLSAVLALRVVQTAVDLSIAYAQA
jgi:hypothetical protein